jgi:hypothetical protein
MSSVRVSDLTRLHKMTHIAQKFRIVRLPGFVFM